jgi:hypothetical protein
MFAFNPNVNGPIFTATVGHARNGFQARANLLTRNYGECESKGGIVFTLVGPNELSERRFCPGYNISVGGVRSLVAGNEPEDGFTGTGRSVEWRARLGDYSAAAVDTDGVIWMRQSTRRILPGH